MKFLIKKFAFIAAPVVLLSFLVNLAPAGHATDANPFPAISGLIARYQPAGFATTGAGTGTWTSTTGNETATAIWGTTDTPTVGTASNSNGASATFNVLTGDHTVRVLFPSDVFSTANYTLFTISRYNSSATCTSQASHGVSNTTDYRNRIFTAGPGVAMTGTSMAGVALSTNNWLSGYWGCAEGVAYHEGWLTQSANDSYLNTSGAQANTQNNWLLGTDCGYDVNYTFANATVCDSRYRAQGVDQTSVSSLTPLSYGPRLTINNSGCCSTEVSNFQVADIIAFNRDLTYLEVQKMETYLARLYGINLNSGTASKLGMYTNSVGSVSGQSFTTAPQIAVQDANGETINTDNTSQIVASINSGGALLGTLTVPVINGVATFSDLGLIGGVGSTYTITYSSATTPSLTAATETRTISSANYSISAGLTGGGSVATYRAATAITATANVPGRFTFTQEGKAIPGCKNVLRSTSPYTVTCSWLPSVIKQVSIGVNMQPSYSGATVAPQNFVILVSGRASGSHKR